MGLFVSHMITWVILESFVRTRGVEPHGQDALKHHFLGEGLSLKYFEISKIS